MENENGKKWHRVDVEATKRKCIRLSTGKWQRNLFEKFSFFFSSFSYLCSNLREKACVCEACAQFLSSMLIRMPSYYTYVPYIGVHCSPLKTQMVKGEKLCQSTAHAFGKPR